MKKIWTFFLFSLMLLAWQCGGTKNTSDNYFFNLKKFIIISFVFLLFLSNLAWGISSFQENEKEDRGNDKKAAPLSYVFFSKKKGYQRPSTANIPEKFLGKFSFVEEMGINAGGTPISYIHSLNIYKKGEEFIAEYNVDGYQSMTRILCRVVGVVIGEGAEPHGLLLIFAGYGNEDLFKADLFKADQVMMEFSLKGGIMARPNETVYELTFSIDYSITERAGKTLQGERLK